jgi:hypothetical protein
VSASESDTGALDLEHVRRLGLAERVPIWKGVCRPRDEIDS